MDTSRRGSLERDTREDDGRGTLNKVMASYNEPSPDVNHPSTSKAQGNFSFCRFFCFRDSTLTAPTFSTPSNMVVEEGEGGG